MGRALNTSPRRDPNKMPDSPHLTSFGIEEQLYSEFRVAELLTLSLRESHPMEEANSAACIRDVVLSVTTQNL